jgi:Thiol-disulfide isomerase and thioredoxins
MKYLSPAALVTTVCLLPLVAPARAQAPAAKPAPAAAAPARTYLTVGDPAPALKPAKWIKGTPVTAFAPGQVYVVEFWATWCGPCKENIPHLTEMAKKYAERGVTVIGASIWEEAKDDGTDALTRVADFVKQQGPKMDYVVAADGADNAIADAWMEPAGEKGIPCAFLVGRDGKIAWIGHPARMEAVLNALLDGKHNVAAEREKRELSVGVLRPIDEAVAAKNHPAVVKHVEAALAKKPDLLPSLAYPYLIALYHSDLPKGRKVTHDILKESDHAPGAYQMIGSIAATQVDLSPEARRFGIEILDEAIRRWPKEFMYRAIKADALFHSGDTAGALTLARGALADAESAPTPSAQVLTLIKKNIARYEAAKKP